MKKFAAYWNDFWFRHEDSINLEAARIVFYAAIAICYYNEVRWHNLSQWAPISDHFWQPVSFFQILDLRTHSVLVLKWVANLWFLALFFSCIGFMTSFSTKASFFLGLYNLGYPLNFGKIHHNGHMAAVVLGIMAWARCGDHYSVDAWIRKQWPKKSIRRPPPIRSPEYHWPLKVIQLAMTLIYMSAGFQKLSLSGFNWAFSDNLANVLLTWGQPMGVWVATHLYFLCPFMAAATMFGELLAPLALFSNKFALVLIPDLFFFHLGARILMGNAAAFTPWMICFVFWFPFRPFLLRAAKKSQVLKELLQEQAAAAIHS